MRAKLTITVDYEPSEQLSEIEEREEADLVLRYQARHIAEASIFMSKTTKEA